MLCPELLRNHGTIPGGGSGVSAVLPSQKSSMHLPGSPTGLLQAPRLGWCWELPQPLVLPGVAEVSVTWGV